MKEVINQSMRSLQQLQSELDQSQASLQYLENELEVSQSLLNDSNLTILSKVSANLLTFWDGQTLFHDIISIASTKEYFILKVHT